MEYGLEMRLRNKKSSLSVSVAAPPDTASIIVLREGETPVAPWSLFQATYGRAMLVQETDD